MRTQRQEEELPHGSVGNIKAKKDEKVGKTGIAEIHWSSPLYFPPKQCFLPCSRTLLIEG